MKSNIERCYTKISEIEEIEKYLPKVKKFNLFIEQPVVESGFNGQFYGKLASLHLHNDLIIGNYIGVFIKTLEKIGDSSFYKGSTVLQFNDKDEKTFYFNVLYPIDDDFEYLEKLSNEEKIHEIKKEIKNEESKIFVFFNNKDFVIDNLK